MGFKFLIIKINGSRLIYSNTKPLLQFLIMSEERGGTKEGRKAEHVLDRTVPCVAAKRHGRNALRVLGSPPLGSLAPVPPPRRLSSRWQGAGVHPLVDRVLNRVLIGLGFARR
jgi:hypothetical protein